MHSTETELYYLALSETYITAYEDETKLSKRILTAMGVIVSMHSELLLYRSKNTVSDKVKKQEERLMLLEEVISEFSVIADRNYQLRYLLQQRGKRNEKEKKDLTTKIEELEKELNIYKQQLEEI